VRYELEQKIGEDELFEHWLGQASGSKERVRIERLRSNVKVSPDISEQLRIAAASAPSAGVEPLVAFVSSDGPLPYWVFADEPRTLVAEALEAAGGTMPAEVAAAIVRELTRLSARVRPGLAHVLVRDDTAWLTPEGGVLLRHPSVCIARFRLSSVAQEKARRSTAPEIWQGQTADERTAVFTLGCIAHQLSTGRSPWNPDDAEIRVDPELDPDLRVIVGACVALRPNSRLATLSALAESLSRYLAQHGVEDIRAELESWLRMLESSQGELPARAGNLFDPSELFGGTDKEPARPRPATEVVGVERGDHARGPGHPADNGPRGGEWASVPATERTQIRDSEPAPVVVEDSIPDPMPSQIALPSRTQIPAKDPLLGMVLHGYRLEQLIGAGTFSRVYRGQHLHLPRVAAIKVLRGDMAASKIAKSRMSREANALSELRHENIVSLLDFGVAPSGLPFLVMELLSGRSLAELLKQQKPLPPRRAGALALGIARGLAAAHARGFIHRDLKPANVMLIGEEGRETLKILDFGVIRDQAEEGSRLTRMDQLVGTPLYMAPDQIRSASEVDTSADLYSLGVILYEMLAGRPPFKGTFDQVLDAHLSAAPPSLPPSLGLDRLALELLAKLPGDRPTSAEEVIRTIEGAIGEEPRVETGTTPWKVPEPAAGGVNPPGGAIASLNALAQPSPSSARSPEPEPEPPAVATRASAVAALPPPSWWRQLAPVLSLALAVAALVIALKTRDRAPPARTPSPVRTSTRSV